MRYLFILIYLLLSVFPTFAQQDYYKIYLHEEGIYKVTGQELTTAGVSLSNIDPLKIQIFTDGNKVLPYSTSDPIPQLSEIGIIVDDGGDSSFDSDDFILFNGKSQNRFEWNSQQNDFVFISNPYDTLSCYWMRFNVENGKRIISKNASLSNPGATFKDEFTDRLHLEKDKNNPLKSGLTWTWNLFENYDQFHVDYELNSVTSLIGEMSVRFSKYGIYGIFASTGEVELMANGNSAGNYNVINSSTISTSIPIQQGTNFFQFNYTPYSSQDTVPQVGLNWINLQYERYTSINENKLKIYMDSTSAIYHLNYKSGSDTDSVLIFDISDHLNVCQLFTSNDSLFEDILINESKTYYLQKYQSLNQVLFIEPSSRNLFSPSDGADYITICPQQWQSELTALQNHRNAYNGFVTKIISIEDIYNEFGFGRKDPTAIRNFIKFAYDNWNPQPQYVLLAGNGYYDYKNITGNYIDNWIPAFEIDANLHEITSRAVDDYYVDINFISSQTKSTYNQEGIVPRLWETVPFNDFNTDDMKFIDNFNSITPDIAIGRLPANDVSELLNMIQKIINYETNFKPGLWRMSSLLISDDQNPRNEYFFLYQTEDLYEDCFHGNSRVLKFYETDYPLSGNEKPGATKDLIKHFNEGNRITLFMGHASEQQWTHENLLNVNRDMTLIRNDGKNPLFIGLGMLYKYDDLNDGILADLIKRPNSGLVATLTANRPVYSGASFSLFRNFLLHIIEDQYSLGQALSAAKSGSQNIQKYHLLSDPALKINFPDKKMVQISISPDTLKAGSLVQISGQIIDPIIEDSLIIEVRQPGRHKEAGPIIYETTGNAIFRGYVPLNGDNFTTQFVVPSSSIFDTLSIGGKFYGYLWGNNSESMFLQDSILFGGIDSSITDIIPPQISLTLSKMDTVANPQFINADIYDENGIDLSSMSNHSPMLFLDNDFSDTIDVSGFFIYNTGSYQSGKIEFRLPPLPAGIHNATLLIHDNFGNFALDSIYFNVPGVEDPVNNMPVGFKLYQNYPNPFNFETHIPFEITGNDIHNIKLQIFNIIGQKVHEKDLINVTSGKYSIKWNGINNNGKEVSSGIYIYRISVRSFNVKYQNFVKSKKMLLIK